MYRMLVATLSVAVFFMISNPCFAAELDQIRKAGDISFSMSGQYPPFNFVNDKNELTGFDVDVCSEIARRIGVKPVPMTTAWDGIIAGLLAGKYNLICGSMAITDSRLKAIDFSDPYINSNQSLAVASDSTVMTTDDLKDGDKVGVQSGTTGEIWAKENLAPKGISVTPYDDVLAAFGALGAGDIAGVINDAPISQDVVKDPARKAKVVQEIPTGEQYGFAFSKESTALKDAVNGALAEIKADGTYVEIYKVWFGAEPLSIP